ncbi:MAG: S24/S26 family peptidase [Clostridia bacterium]|nr:S24/S26 family peptidase [Clostridia bacterium]
MTEQMQLRDLLPVMQEVLCSGGEFTFCPSGGSMRPMLSGDCSVTIRKAEGRLDRLDLPLYRTRDGQFVLHRVVKVLPDSYVMLGDSNLLREEGITDSQIVGVVCAFSRKGKKHSTDEPLYRLYCRVWTALPLLRRLLPRAK